MWKLVIILALIPLVGAWLARHWFWTRASRQGLRRDCGTSVRELRERLGLPPGTKGKETHAAALGNALRECGLRLMEQEGSKLAKARVTGGYVTLAMPALAGVIAFFAILSKRVPAGWAHRRCAGRRRAVDLPTADRHGHRMARRGTRHRGLESDPRPEAGG